MGFTLHTLLASDMNAAVDDLLVQGSPFRYHRYFSREELLLIAREDFSRRLQGEAGVAFSLWQAQRLAGFSCLSRASWDSLYFGQPMARLELWGLAGVPTAVIADLLNKTLAADRSYRHVACRVGEGGYDVINALAATGFSLRDVQRVYVARDTAGKGRSLYMPRPCLSADTASLLALFRATAFASRYTRDTSLPADKTGGIYEQWISNLLKLPEADREIYVLEREGRVVAAGAGRYADFSAAGVARKMMTDGIFASGKGYTGSYIGITQAVVAAAMARGYPLAELKVSADNIAANRVLQSLGYESVFQSYALHRPF